MNISGKSKGMKNLCFITLGKVYVSWQITLKIKQRPIHYWSK